MVDLASTVSKLTHHIRLRSGFIKLANHVSRRLEQHQYDVVFGKTHPHSNSNIRCVRLVGVWYAHLYREVAAM